MRMCCSNTFALKHYLQWYGTNPRINIYYGTAGVCENKLDCLGHIVKATHGPGYHVLLFKSCDASRIISGFEHLQDDAQSCIRVGVPTIHNTAGAVVYQAGDGIASDLMHVSLSPADYHENLRVKR